MNTVSVAYFVESRGSEPEVFSAHPEKYETYPEALAASDVALSLGRTVLIVREVWSGNSRSVRYAGGHRVP